MQQQSGRGSGQIRNSRAAPSSGRSGNGNAETVRYVNRQERPDHPVHDS